MKHFLVFSLLICFLLFPAGCLAPYPAIPETNATKTIDDLTTRQSYYDNLVQSDPTNSTTWVLRGNYYNDFNNQYEKALINYDRALELDPTNGYAWYSKGVALKNNHMDNESEVCFENAKKMVWSFRYNVSGKS
ncbi:tetratricopeptide repeat protein [Methanoregula sp.]|uniref:tetratricopeptide repeat protein n=1 Tax=Methanoregula sp. TaxID=2052170 RepID=UPI002617BD65|nr:tetratricopeptide repeat protein [Methanoregula sp.]MDD5142365.1 tetratricopeptide repeat protein [Methanoregula sp.]